MRKFKVGDKVRVVSYPDDEWGVTGSETTVIESNENSQFTVTEPVGADDATLFYEKELQLIEEEDVVNKPSHYTKGFSNGAEVIDIVENLPYNAGAAVKYLARAGKKDATKEIEDLLKARWYVNRQLSKLGHTEEEK